MPFQTNRTPSASVCLCFWCPPVASLMGSWERSHLELGSLAWPLLILYLEICDVHIKSQYGALHTSE